jgi:uncharacterized repeat protein (TIGR03803 family)
MRGNRFSIGLRAVLAMVSLALFATVTAAGVEKVLYNFGCGADGGWPWDGLIMDAAGNLYGTTQYGGSNPCPWGGGCGTVFELSPSENGDWTERVLYNFAYDQVGNYDGAYPVAGLIFDAAGNLYGTTQGGGDYLCQGGGCGTVFELTPTEGGGWTEKKLHDFWEVGTNPNASLIFDAAGNLYSTTTGGGIHDSGTVFELSPGQGGGWTEKVLHSFNPNGDDGASPMGSLIFDAAGNLYGTTSLGGAYGAGTAFELTRNQDGNWEEPPRLRHFGHDLDGSMPNANLIFDAAGNLYGTTATGGGHDNGTVFELTPVGDGRWSEKQLHDFTRGGDGFAANSGLIWDAAGHLYGTTWAGGTHNLGTVFEITP